MPPRSCAGLWLAPASPGRSQPDQALPDRADRSDAGAVGKGLEGALVRDVGPYRAPGRGRLVGAVLPRHGVNTRMSPVFVDVIQFRQNFGALECVHRDASFSI